MSQENILNLATKYFVNDLPESTLSGSFLGKILQQIEAQKSLSEATLARLKKKPFKALCDYSIHAISFEQYSLIAQKEQQQRILYAEKQAFEADVLKKEAEQRQLVTAKKLEEIAKQEKQVQEAREKDPKYIKQQEARTLKNDFGIDFYVEPHDYKKLLAILKILAKYKRITETQIAWLYKTENGDYLTDEILTAYHNIEANFFAEKFKQSKNIWNAINACSHYRKARIPLLADVLMSDIDTSKIKNKKQQSACYTTHGGAKRDLEKYDKAIEFGLKAHELTLKDFRPCTLIGAVNMEKGNFDEGHTWYEKAIERGYDPNARDQDLKKIYLNMKGQEQKDFASFLKNSYGRFKWLKKEHR